MAKLIQFTVGNYRSFKEKRTFTFVPTSIQDEPKESIYSRDKERLSTVSAIYGANSSGKSNLVQAIAVMSYIIESSVRLNDSDELMYDPFMLSTEGRGEPTFFEIVYLNDNNKRIRYGFENNEFRILREWLFTSTTSGDDTVLFVREEDGIAVNETLFPEGVNREEMTNDNRLFLSLVAQLGGVISKSVLSFFHADCNILSGIDNRGYASFTKRKFKVKDDLSAKAMKFFKLLQLGFTHIDVEEQEVDINDSPSEFKTSNRPVRLEVYSSHNLYDVKGKIIGERKFQFSDFESNGTQKIFELAGPIFDTLAQGSILIIDELDAKMHPLISQQIVRLFTDRSTNPNHAQLLFTTHDTNLLSSRLLRRDQIWFTEKDKTETSDLYRFTDIVLPDGSKLRGDGNIEKNYIRGRYGAIPYITDSLE